MSKVAITSMVRSPYGGMYHWRDPITGVEVKGTTGDMLYQNAVAERLANGVPMGLEFWDSVMADVCRDYPTECSNVDPTQIRKRGWSMGDIVRGTLVMMNHKLNGSQLVSQEEANRRAQICSTCPHAAFFTKPCTGLCRELSNLLGSTGNKSTPYDNDLRACNICGCWTKVAVWFPLETQCVGVTEEMKTQFAGVSNCWKQCE